MNHPTEDGFANQLLRVAGGLEFESPGFFRLDGVRYGASGEDTVERNSVLSQRARRVLSHLLYVTMHCRQPAEQFSWHPPHEAATVREFITRLSKANTGRESWQAGWSLLGAEPGRRLSVWKNGLGLSTARMEFRPSRPGRLRRGTRGSVKMPKELLGMFPGFYMALGEIDHSGTGKIVRLYWHVRAEGAEELTSQLTRGLNARRIPFRFKVLANPMGYVRSDAAVLYLRQRDYAPVERVAKRVHADLRHCLKDPVSMFVKALAPGLGLAEDPPDHSSFGDHRSHLLAECLSHRSITGNTSPKERAQAIRSWLRRAGVKLAMPYLNRDSTDRYPRFAE